MAMRMMSMKKAAAKPAVGFVVSAIARLDLFCINSNKVITTVTEQPT